MSDPPTQETSNPASAHVTVVPTNPVEQRLSENPAPTPVVNTTTRPAPLAQLAQANFIRPRARLARYNVEIRIGSRATNENAATQYSEFCTLLYNYLFGLIETSGGDSSNAISSDDFVRVCQTLLVHRVQQVREHRLAQRAAANRVNISRTFSIPAALYEILSGIGEIYLEHHGYSYVPNLPAVASPVPDYYTVDPTMMLNFIVFVDSLQRASLHRAVTIPSQYEGTPYWILSRTSGPNVTVSGVTGEGTPADGLLRALIDISAGAPFTAGFIYVDSIDYRTLLHAYFSMN